MPAELPALPARKRQSKLIAKSYQGSMNLRLEQNNNATPM
jgi:hypothetical protein